MSCPARTGPACGVDEASGGPGARAALHRRAQRGFLRAALGGRRSASAVGPQAAELACGAVQQLAVAGRVRHGSGRVGALHRRAGAGAAVPGPGSLGRRRRPAGAAGAAARYAAVPPRDCRRDGSRRRPAAGRAVPAGWYPVGSALGGRSADLGRDLCSAGRGRRRGRANTAARCRTRHRGRSAVFGRRRGDEGRCRRPAPGCAFRAAGARLPRPGVLLCPAVVPARRCARDGGCHYPADQCAADRGRPCRLRRVDARRQCRSAALAGLRGSGDRCDPADRPGA